MPGPILARQAMLQCARGKAAKSSAIHIRSGALVVVASLALSWLCKNFFTTRRPGYSGD
jgi:hypothetical protein